VSRFGQRPRGEQNKRHEQRGCNSDSHEVKRRLFGKRAIPLRLSQCAEGKE